MKTYITVYFGSLIMAMLITPLIIRIALRLGIVDAPGVRKVHTKAIPRIGGVAVFLSMMALIIPVLFLPNAIGDGFRQIQTKIAALLIAATFMFFVGLVDDVKHLRVRVKLAAQLIAASIVCWSGIRINSIALSDSLSIDFGWFSWVVTIFWIVGITNAVNFIDGLDGLAAGICAAACGVIVILTFHFGPAVMTILMLTLLGSLSGFLFFNFNPAKIFMGDCGSLFLGFTIASSSILCSAKTETIVGLALPALALGVPIFDTIFSMLRRFLQRRSIFSPDQGHFHHRLLAFGLNQRHAVIVTYMITLLAASLGMLMIFTRNAQTVVIFVCILFLIVLAFRAVGSIRFRETIAGLKQKHNISHQAKKEKEDFDQIQLHFCRAENFEQWWQAVYLAANKMKFVSGSLPLTNRDGSLRTLTWKKPGSDAEPEDIVRMTLPIKDRRSDSTLKLELGIHRNDSIESVGRRIALFGRLIEERGIAELPYNPKETQTMDYQTSRSTETV